LLATGKIVGAEETNISSFLEEYRQRGSVARANDAALSLHGRDVRLPLPAESRSAKTDEKIPEIVGAFQAGGGRHSSLIQARNVLVLFPEVFQGDLKALVVHLLVFAHGLFRTLRAAVEELDDVCNRRRRSPLIEFFNAG
jgi:hypothetical protein